MIFLLLSLVLLLVIGLRLPRVLLVLVALVSFYRLMKLLVVRDVIVRISRVLWRRWLTLSVVRVAECRLGTVLVRMLLILTLLMRGCLLFVRLVVKLLSVPSIRLLFVV